MTDRDIAGSSNGTRRAAAYAPEHLARYRWAQELVAGGRVLDVGCGRGHGTRMLAVRAREVVGVDVSPAHVADARRDHGDEAVFREGDMRQLPFEDGEFDAVVCFEALAQVADPEAAVDELRRVLRPRGLLLVSSPNRESYPPGNPLHARELTSDELEALLAARFANVAIHGQQSYHATLLATRGALAHADPAADVAARVAKSEGAEPGSELYAIAAATDGDLPPEPAQVVLGRHLEHERQARLVAELRERCVAAEAEAVGLRHQVEDLRRRLDGDA